MTFQELQLCEPIPKRRLDCTLIFMSGKWEEKIHSFLLASLKYIWGRRAGGCLTVHSDSPVVPMINGISGLKKKSLLKFPSSATPRNSLLFETVPFKEADRSECIQRKVIKMKGNLGKLPSKEKLLKTERFGVGKTRGYITAVSNIVTDCQKMRNETYPGPGFPNRWCKLMKSVGSLIWAQFREANFDSHK